MFSRRPLKKGGVRAPRLHRLTSLEGQRGNRRGAGFHASPDIDEAYGVNSRQTKNPDKHAAQHTSVVDLRQWGVRIADRRGSLLHEKPDLRPEFYKKKDGKRGCEGGENETKYRAAQKEMANSGIDQGIVKGIPGRPAVFFVIHSAALISSHIRVYSGSASPISSIISLLARMAGSRKIEGFSRMSGESRR